MSSFNKIFEKEYIKLKFLLLAILICNVASIIYDFLAMKSMFTLNSSVVIWLDYIEKNSLYFSNLPGVMALTGLLIGFMQFLPEVEKKRFRISCHLPVNESVMMFSMVFSGVIFMSVIALADLTGVMISGVAYLPREIYMGSLGAIIKAYFSMIAIYLYAVVVTLEPNKVRKIFLFIILLPVTLLFAQANGYNSMDGEILTYLILLLCFVPMVLNPAFRFRKGDF